MKKNIIVYLACFILMVLSASVAFSGSNATTASGYQFLTSIIAPLPYQWVAPANMPVNIIDPLLGTTGNCLTCHDGTTTGIYGSRVVNDFTITHPVGFLYDDALVVRNTDPYKPELALTAAFFIDRVFTGAQSVLNGNTTGWTYTNTPLGNTFDSGFVTCNACHDGHGQNNVANDPQIDPTGSPTGFAPNYYVRAREQGSALCLSCHRKSGTGSSSSAAAPGGGVNGSMHDITYLGAAMGFYNQDQYQRVCIFCHTPHNAMDANQTGGTPAPLWNHQVSSLVNPLPYQWASPANLPINIIDPLFGTNRLCLGCHDGMTAVDAHGGSGTVNNGNHIMSGPVVINDFTISHPMGFQYADALALRNDDPTKPALMTPGSFFIDRILSGSISSYTTQQISNKLYSGFMSCATCHDVHNSINAVNDPKVDPGGNATNYAPNLFVSAREQGSALCTSCHNMAAINSTGSNIYNSSHDITYLGAGMGFYNQDQYQRVCIFCHTPHNAMDIGQTGGIPAPLWNHQLTSLISPVPYQWKDQTNTNINIIDPLLGPTSLCLGCHDGMTAVDAHGGIGQNNNGNHVMSGAKVIIDFTDMHPVGFLFDDALIVGSNLKAGLSPSTFFLNTKVTIGSRLYFGFFTCATCHDVHNGKVQNFLVGGISATDLCLSCHTSVPAPVAHHFSSVNVTPVTVDTNTPGLSITVDGSPYTAPQTFYWVPGSSHTIGTTRYQNEAAGTRSTFSSWSDGEAMSHTISVPGVATAYKATFTTQYQLTTALTPAGAGTVSPVSGSWYDAGAVAPVKAFLNVGYNFVSWSGSVANSATAATTVSMTGAQTITANLAGVPVLSAVISGKTTPNPLTPGIRTWNITLSNSNKATATATAARLDGFTLTQTFGTACTPVISPFLHLLGDIASSGSASRAVTIDFSSCAAIARFTATINYSSNGGTVTGSKSYGNQFR
jgi:predicted CXXCH cytochrome family protein